MQAKGLVCKEQNTYLGAEIYIHHELASGEKVWVTSFDTYVRHAVEELKQTVGEESCLTFSFWI